MQFVSTCCSALLCPCHQTCTGQNRRATCIHLRQTAICWAPPQTNKVTWDDGMPRPYLLFLWCWKFLSHFLSFLIRKNYLFNNSIYSAAWVTRACRTDYCRVHRGNNAFSDIKRYATTLETLASCSSTKNQKLFKIFYHIESWDMHKTLYIDENKN